VSDFYHFESGQQVGGLDPSRSKYGTFCSFIDPDGNGWLLRQQHLIGRRRRGGDPGGRKASVLDDQRCIRMAVGVLTRVR
jgi:hypothetical protein